MLTNKERIDQNNSELEACIALAKQLTEPNIQPLNVTENGTYEPPEGVHGYSPVTVEVASSGDGMADKVAEGGHAEINLPNATRLKNYAFYEDGSLINILMPRVTSIGKNAFRNCSNLTLASLPDGLTSIGGNAFNGCTKLALTSLPDGLITIDQYTFYNCTKLALTSLPAGVSSIGISAFTQCSSLALTSLPDGVTSIGNSAFNNCANLALTSLPNSVTSISDRAFHGCTGLTEITFEGTPTTINSTAFANCTNLTTINVPWAEGAVANAPWGATNATINYNYTGE